MAAHSNRSPSPLSSRPMNPNPRNSENNPTIRRSFSGNNALAKPSSLISPSDFAKRRSVSKEGAAPHLKDCHEKENDDKDCVLKAPKLQSSAKGCKNFMAPTISAASKFTPSPRKKVLVERNDPIRTSISLSEGKAMFFSAISDASKDLELKSEVGHHQNQKNESFPNSNLADYENKAVLESHQAPRPSCKKVTFSDIPSDSQHSAESVITDSDNLELESKVVQSPIAPLDADPFLPPYDPKTNYLSPRPSFMRYKPNPRVEMILNTEKELLLPDELEATDTVMADIMPEGFLHSDEGTDESQSEDASKEEVKVTTSPDKVIGLDEEIEVHDPADEISEEEYLKKNVKKPRSLTRLMCFSMIMVFLVSVSVRGVPSFDEIFIKDLSFSDVSSMYEQYSRVAVDYASLGFDHSWDNYVSPIFKMVEGEQRVQLQFVNLTELQENTRKEAYCLKRVEEYEDEEDEDSYAAEENEEEEHYAETEIFEEEEEYYAEEGDYEYFPEDDVVVATKETCSDSAKTADMESESWQDVHNQAAAEVSLDEKPQAHINLETSEESLNIPIMVAEAEESLIAGHAVAIYSSSSSIFAAAGLLGVVALIYYYRKRSWSANVVQVETRRDYISTVEKKQQSVIKQEMELSETWVTESEMSSSYHHHQIGNEEVESSEMKGRRRRYSKRESSMASSSGSPSYGSFTTYERVPVKINGNGEDEIMTPVRRSSRIKNMATSPLIL